MAKKKIQGSKGGNKKIGRSKIKASGKSNAIALFVRNKISAEEYFKKTNQAVKA